jgi:hypothetical protein
MQPALQQSYKKIKSIFPVEKNFNLDGSDGFSYYCIICFTTKMSSNFGGGTIMVSAAIRVRSKTLVCWITTKTSSQNYTDLLDEILIPFLNEKIDENTIFIAR